MAAEVSTWSSEAWTSAADLHLLDRVRQGSAEAFGELWRRHLPAAYAVAHRFRGRTSAEDIVADASTRVFALMQQGKGPEDNFRSYFLSAVKSAAIDAGRRELKVVPAADEDLETLATPVEFEAAEDSIEPELVRTAFRNLSERDRRVLWHTTVEGEAPRNVAPLLGMTANAVSASAVRARESLRASYLDAHAGQALAGADSAECRWVIDKLGAHVRGRLPKRQAARVEAHLANCRHASAVVTQLRSIHDEFPALIVPLIFAAGLSTPGFVGITALTGAGAAAGGGLAARRDAQQGDLVAQTASRLGMVAAGVAIGVGAAGAFTMPDGLAPSAASSVAGSHGSSFGAGAGSLGSITADGAGAAGAGAAGAAGGSGGGSVPGGSGGSVTSGGSGSVPGASGGPMTSAPGSVPTVAPPVIGPGTDIGSDSGGADSGGTDPGGMDPGGMDPGGTDPGGTDPGSGDTGGSTTGTPTPRPTRPTPTPTTTGGSTSSVSSSAGSTATTPATTATTTAPTTVTTTATTTAVAAVNASLELRLPANYKDFGSAIDWARAATAQIAAALGLPADSWRCFTTPQAATPIACQGRDGVLIPVTVVEGSAEPGVRLFVDTNADGTTDATFDLVLVPPDTSTETTTAATTTETTTTETTTTPTPTETTTLPPTETTTLPPTETTTLPPTETTTTTTEVATATVSIELHLSSPPQSRPYVAAAASTAMSAYLSGLLGLDLPTLPQGYNCRSMGSNGAVCAVDGMVVLATFATEMVGSAGEQYAVVTVVRGGETLVSDKRIDLGNFRQK